MNHLRTEFWDGELRWGDNVGTKQLDEFSSHSHTATVKDSTGDAQQTSPQFGQWVDT